MYYLTANSFYKQTCEYDCSIALMSRHRDRIGKRGGGVILYVKESIQAYEIKLERKQITMKLFGAK